MKPLTDAEKKRPYSKYYYRTMASVPDETIQILRSGPIDPNDALLFERKNDLLKIGYHKSEIGYCFMPDNSCYTAMLTRMPGVSGEMLDWWFWWHAVEDLRYKIWYPAQHFGNSVKDPGQLQNPVLSARKRYWYNPHYPIEDVGFGKEKLIITFMPPEDFGFNTSRFVEGNIATILCARVGSVARKTLHTDMCHVVRNTVDGVEMRSRFWIGRKIRLTKFSDDSLVQRLFNTKFIRKLLLPSDAPKQMAYHCAREYCNLAEILPELYRGYGMS